VKKAGLLLVVASGGVVIGFCLAILLYKPQPVEAAPRTGGIVPVAKVSIDDGPEHWARRGFVEMVPPVRLPSDTIEADHIAVWLKVPDDKKISARVVDGLPRLRFPAGTTADRVETFTTNDGVVVGDVRGTTLLDATELWHVYVPAGDGPKAPLVGWEWLRNDADAERAATSLLVRHLTSTHTVHDARAPKKDFVDDYRRNNACARCHLADKRENLADPTAIHRPTDDNGWYLPLAVLMDTVPLEGHRARDMNVGDALLALECPSGQAPVLDENDGGARKYRCADGGVPVGTLDVTAGLNKRDPRTISVCHARRYLFDHMEPDARALFKTQFAECGF
jgi:hypothetical protein